MRRAITGLLLVGLWLHATPTTSPLSSGDIDDAVAQLAKITGLAPLRKVQKDTITREGVRKFLEQKLKEEVKPEDIRVEELALKKFGLVPQAFDLKSATVDLITEQAAAFYDFRTKKLYLLEGDDAANGVAGGQKMIVTHELAHALADQHFDLGKFIKKEPQRRRLHRPYGRHGRAGHLADDGVDGGRTRAVDEVHAVGCRSDGERRHRLHGIAVPRARQRPAVPSRVAHLPLQSGAEVPAGGRAQNGQRRVLPGVPAAPGQHAADPPSRKILRSRRAAQSRRPRDSEGLEEDSRIHSGRTRTRHSRRAVPVEAGGGSNRARLARRLARARREQG